MRHGKVRPNSEEQVVAKHVLGNVCSAAVIALISIGVSDVQALTMQECSKKYQAARSKGTLGGTTSGGLSAILGSRLVLSCVAALTPIMSNSLPLSSTPSKC